MTDQELTNLRNEIYKEEEERKACEKIAWHREQIQLISKGELPHEDICEWCGANHTRGEKCDELTHYTNR